MAETLFRGPLINAGGLMDNAVGPFDGPNISYQGSCIPDVRYSPMKKDGTLPCLVPSFAHAPTLVSIDAIPSIASTTTIAGAQSITQSTALTLNTTAAGGTGTGVPSWAPGVPIIPYGGTTTVSVSAIDFGGTTGTTTANSSTVVVADATILTNGAWYVIGGVGNSAKTQALITQLVTTLNATTVNFVPVPLAALNNAPIGNANIHGTGLTPPPTQFGPSAVTPNAALPYINGGFALLFDPTQGVARNISVTGSNATATAAFTMVGYDIYGQSMSEIITAVGTTTIFGKKAFKYFVSATPNVTQAGSTYSVGLGDTFGFHVRADKFPYVTVMWNNSLATSANGFTTAAVGVATNSTGDVRGTIQISTSGALGTSAFNLASNGTSRLFMAIDVPLYNMIKASPLSTVSLFGNQQA